MNLQRFEALIGADNLDKIKKTKILLIGIGGVGGYALESLVRSGIQNITIVDYDKIDSSNLNRQILTNTHNIGQYKTKEAIKRYKLINPSLNINSLEIFLDSNSLNKINIENYDYIIDACDSIDTKALLISEANRLNIKIISSMGTAKKLDASKLSITTLDKTSYDPLAKKLRKVIDKNLQKKTVVISSIEKAYDTKILGSTSYVPAVAGLLITNYIINDILKEAID